MKCARLTCSRKVQSMGLCLQHYRAATRDIPTGRVSTEPAALHITALRDAGLGLPRIAELAGVSKPTVWRIPRREQMLAGIEAKILAVPIPDRPIEIASDGAYINGVGTRRRLQALQAIGYTRADLAARIGMSEDGVSDLARGKGSHVTAGLGRRIDAAFRELQLTPGSNAVTRARSLKKGWLPPFAWDEDTIDDPGAEPDLGEHHKLDWLAEYGELLDFGLTQQQAADRMGLKLDTLEARLRRLVA